MRYKIEFVKGSLGGKIAPLDSNTSFVIGRSHSCELRPTESDVSARHVVLSVNSNNIVVLKVLSRHATFLNSTRLLEGGEYELKSGDAVTMGGTCSFRLIDGGGGFLDLETMTSINPKNDDVTRVDMGLENTFSNGESVAFDATRSIAEKTIVFSQQMGKMTDEKNSLEGNPFSVREDGETVILGTMAGSEEEMLKIKRDFQIRRRNKILMWMIPSVLIFVSVIVAYIALKPKPEEFLTWPKDRSGNFLNRYALVEPFLAICVPDVPFYSEKRSGGKLEVRSAIGRDRDVPLSVNVKKITNNALLRKNHSESFLDYLKSIRDSDTSFAFGDNVVRRFINTDVGDGAGVPMSYVDYTRRVGENELFGYMVFLRKASNAYVFNIEIPLNARWRGEGFIRSNLTSFVLYAKKRVPEHWEGSEALRGNETTAKRDFEDAKAHIIYTRSPQKWEKGFFCLLSALVKASESGDEKLVLEAVSVLVKLRSHQSEWYNTMKLGYLEAKVSGDKERMKSTQATCESIFTHAFRDFDYRYESIKRKEWK